MSPYNHQLGDLFIITQAVEHTVNPLVLIQFTFILGSSNKRNEKKTQQCGSQNRHTKEIMVLNNES